MHLKNQQSAATHANPDEMMIVFEPSILFNDPQCPGREYFHNRFDEKKTPAEEIVELENLIKQYEDEPILASHLAAAYRNINNHDFADQIVRDNYRKFPFSIFARCDYAYLCLGENRPTQAAAALDYTFNIQDLYPKRSRFHLLELVKFQGLVANYFCSIKDFNRAVTALIPSLSLHKDISNIKNLRSLIISRILEDNLSAKSLDILFADTEDEDGFSVENKE